MAYTELTNIVLKSNYQAKEVSLIVFNDFMARLETFVNTLNANIEFVKTDLPTLVDGLLLDGKLSESLFPASVLSAYILDTTTTVIAHTLVDNNDTTYTQSNPTAVTIVIPDTVLHGFHAGINFKSGTNVYSVTFTNNSGLDLKIHNNGQTIVEYVPTLSRMVDMIFYSEGVNVYCYINEVE
jgi:hypothetical protein